MFKVSKCTLEYVEVRQRLHAHDRILNSHHPFFVETNQGKKKFSYSLLFFFE